MSAFRMVPALLLALGLTGCAGWMEMLGNNAGLPSESKLVQTKVEPDLLIAVDGSQCRVPKARFQKIQPPQYITCVWTDRGGRTDLWAPRVLRVF